MPTVGLNRDDLFERLGKTYTQEEFELLCFEFGVELDDVTSEAEAASKMGMDAATIKAKCLSSAVEYAIDVPANRYDLLCMEGMARCAIFLGLEPTPQFELVEPEKRYTMTVDSDSTNAIRPFVTSSTRTSAGRTIVAIGTHDLATLTPEFTYAARAPETIDFVPLTETDKSWKAKALLDHYKAAAECKHLKPYCGIIYDAPNYPVIRDAAGVVLSLPPIINGRHSRIQAHTTDVFIECTATDEYKANVVCNTMVAMFSEYCAFKVEPVDVVYKSNGAVTRTVATPDLKPRSMTAKLDDIRGVDAASRGYNNVPEKLPKTTTTGGPTRLNAFSDLLRDEVSRAGYVEILTHGLCRLDEQFDKLGHGDRADEKAKAVTLSNPSSEEFEIVRTSLLVGALKTLQHSKSHTLVATYTGATAGFEVIHGLADRILACARVPPTDSYAGNSLKGYDAAKAAASEVHYAVDPVDDPTYFPGRCAHIVLVASDGAKTPIGTMGIVHPAVLANFDIDYPTSAIELDVEALAGCRACPPCGC
ncbi:phenylalanine-tRNA ligase [Aureococcus anophagefferens]|nr:phenylalanine-tRNA ligase [Aureococcus anophagefferens]